MKTLLFIILLISGLFFTVTESMAHHTKEHTAQQAKTTKED
jgi:hypothetical protein